MMSSVFRAVAPAALRRQPPRRGRGWRRRKLLGASFDVHDRPSIGRRGVAIGQAAAAAEQVKDRRGGAGRLVHHKHGLVLLLFLLLERCRRAWVVRRGRTCEGRDRCLVLDCSDDAPSMPFLMFSPLPFSPPSLLADLLAS